MVTNAIFNIFFYDLMIMIGFICLVNNLLWCFFWYIVFVCLCFYCFFRFVLCCLLNSAAKCLANETVDWQCAPSKSSYLEHCSFLKETFHNTRLSWCFVQTCLPNAFIQNAFSAAEILNYFSLLHVSTTGSSSAPASERQLEVKKTTTPSHFITWQ